MVTETVRYYDGIEGKEVEKKLYFNLTRSEVSELGFDLDGGWEGLQQRVDNDFRGSFSEYYRIIKNMVVTACGVKTRDGMHFIKPEEETLKFKSSEAYSAIIDKLFSDETGETMINFMQKVMEDAKRNSPAPKNVLTMNADA